MVAVVATTAVSGLSCYYSSVAETMVLSSAETTAAVTTTVADANLGSTQKRGVQKALLFTHFIIHQLKQRLLTVLHMAQYDY